MDGLSVTKTVFIVFMLTVGLVTCFAALLRSSLAKTEFPLRYVFKSLIISHALAFVVNCSDLLIGTISDCLTEEYSQPDLVHAFTIQEETDPVFSSCKIGSWPLGDTACQIFGFTSLIFSSGAIWTFAIAAIDRYYLFLLSSEHPSTFSQKNMNILMAGMYILMTLVATGPLYGLGQYSHNRGYLEMTVYANSTLQNITEEYKKSTEHKSVNTLHQMIISQNFNDPLSRFSNGLNKRYDISVARVLWVEGGTTFFLRADRKYDAMEFWKIYQENSLVPFISDHLWSYELLQTGKIHNISFYAYIDVEDFENYINVYLPSQELGQCAVDFTSPQVHAKVWSGYQLCITTILPYVIVLFAYTVIFCKNPYNLNAFHKNITNDDVMSLQIFSISSIVCCLFSAVYYGALILNSHGTFISTNALFGISFVYYASDIAVFTPVLFSECTCFAILRSKCQLCWVYSRDSISNEISEIKLKQTRRKFSVPVIHYNIEMQFKPRHV